MTPRTLFSRTRLSIAGAALAFPLALAGCTSATTSTTSDAPATMPAPAGHVHAISVDPVTTEVLLATHDGLYDATGESSVKVGTNTIDLMGFTPTADPQVFYASGHPGPGSTLPNPVGLIRSTDAGKTWEPLSRQGQSDFHALTASRDNLVAFDGELRTSTDGITWDTSTATFAPAVLASNPSTPIVLATTEEGLQRSTDGGKTWEPVPTAPLMQFVAFAASAQKAPTDVAGVAPDGSVHVSTDAGLTWTATGTVEGEVQAITALAGDAGKPAIWASTTTGIQNSTDGGATFSSATP
ncbi:F510_1955 family glycosylhydrolase [Arthrobacter sp. H35-D1]|uniref:F510_1955 family glycosylhydrolase n=1 Tax=Arthrobacter sp. H35-D1 TaxID=3046202 RepID=UPI0024BBC894|nr:exo-alpha-sialidase [Arthrobacter sp. H35-D1]MDJ0313166.1 exo-alpha-sialidase [Arthrobacter sp. H35-D1]